jgi:hypothetical protein
MFNKIAKSCKHCKLATTQLHITYDKDEVCSECLAQEYNDVCGFLNKSFDEIAVLQKSNNTLEQRIKKLESMLSSVKSLAQIAAYG